jgi:hypothetical protein
VPCIECKACGHEVDAAPADRYVCPACGVSEGLHIAVTLTDSAGVHDSLRTQGYDENGREFLDAKSGDSYFRKDAEWHELTQVVDRRDRRYKKKIVRKSTGEVLRDEDVRLEEHDPTAIKRRREQEGNKHRAAASAFLALASFELLDAVDAVP